MDAVAPLIEAKQWVDATAKAQALGISPDVVYQSRWLSLGPDVSSQEAIETLSAIGDRRWAASACLNARILDNSTMRDVILHGVATTDQLTTEADIASKFTSPSDSSDFQEGVECLQSSPLLQTTCRLRIELFRRLYLLDTYEEIISTQNPLDDDDPWAENSDNTDEPITQEKYAPATFSEFATVPLLRHALAYAATCDAPAVDVLLRRHSVELFPKRFTILAAFPENVDVPAYAALLPVCSNGSEVPIVSSTPPLPFAQRGDWVHSEAIANILNLSSNIPTSLTHLLLSESKLSEWYYSRLQAIDRESSLHLTLSFARTVTSLGVSAFSATYKELEILESFSRCDNTTVWSLSRWDALDPHEQFRTLLLYSTPDSIASDLRSRVIPLLQVQQERSADTSLPICSKIRDYILNELSVRMTLLAPVIQASSPTLPSNERILNDDKDLACICIACLYACTRTDSWEQMSAIFECLPEFQTEKSDTKAAETSLASLFSSKSSNTILKASGLYDITKNWSGSTLARVLDLIDVHLSQAEIFQRWDVPVTLAWFVQSVDDRHAQVACATKFARREVGHYGEFESDDEWMALMDDMLSWTEEREDGIRLALNLLERQSLLRIFFGGVLSTGRFSLAKTLFKPSNGKRPLDNKAQEELVTSASREFYDNAETGNMNNENMKKALECLSIAPSTPIIRAEKDLIEATSRLTSFRIRSPQGYLLAPIEIRMTHDRLELIERLLSSNKDAHLYPDMLLDLADKLGYRGDLVARVRVLAMVAYKNGEARQYSNATAVCDRMIMEVETLWKKRRRHEDKTASNAEVSQDPFDIASGVAWKACKNIASQDDFTDYESRLRLTSQALRFCPAATISELLLLYRPLRRKDLRTLNGEKAFADENLENVNNTLSSDAARHGSNDDKATNQSYSPLPFSLQGSIRSAQSQALQSVTSPVITPSEVAERAARSFSRAASSYFGKGSTISPSSAGPVGNNSTSRSQSPLLHDLDSSTGRNTSPSGSAFPFMSRPLSSSPSQPHRDTIDSSLSQQHQPQTTTSSSSVPLLSLSTSSALSSATSALRPMSPGSSGGVTKSDQENHSDGTTGASIGDTISDRFTAGVGWLIGADEEI